MVRTSEETDTFIVLAVLYYAVGITASIGWLLNIVKIFAEHDQTWFISRIVGIFVPFVGAVLGWM